MGHGAKRRRDVAEGARTVTGSRWNEGEEAVLVAGDFNAHEANWATEDWNGRTNAAGRLLSEWMGAQGWELGLEAGTPTRGIGSERGGAALDLVFLSPALHRLGWLRECRVRQDLHVGADHEVIWTELEARPTCGDEHDGLGRLSERRTDVEILTAEFESMLPQFEASVAAAVEATDTADPAATDRLDEAAQALCSAMKASLETSTPRSSGKRGGYAWWTADCASAHARYRSARQQQQRAPRSARYQDRFSRCRSQFHKAVIKAKRSWARQKIEDLQGNDIFGAMRWSAGRRKYRSPPLMDGDGNVMVGAEEKSELLRRILLPAPAAANLPPLDLHLPHNTTSVDEPLTELEVERALFDQDPKKAPGPDDVGFLTLRRLWPLAKGSMVKLLATALRLGWHPSVFRQATLVALKKNGNRDPAQPRSYRLISLLPCLGKVLEKIVAQRLMFYARKYGWVPPEQFGGMPGCSTDDAALTLIHDVEAGWAKREQRTTSALAFDVKGAFDATHGERLVHLLYRLGCPLHLVRWVRSFLTARHAAIRLDGETSPMTPLNTGIPQGSPVSPILFIIFVSPLLRLFGPQSEDPVLRKLRVIGFIDDGLIYTSSLDIEQNCQHLAYGYRAAAAWAEEVGLTFDPNKRELIHFSPPFARLPPAPVPLPSCHRSGAEARTHGNQHMGGQRRGSAGSRGRSQQQQPVGGEDFRPKGQAMVETGPQEPAKTQVGARSCKGQRKRTCGLPC
ncbi:hypothetical protein A4X13_0g8396 [Tilletia indica]|uniref:Reverse transcriptase domain-containing protein n=1 Tax=Tilletia indica TaxID=43049 RepID=A0A8T8SF35_9BASI|nr:hypothetical protein A4X13_0g8396 [Tilletia indica]